MSRLKFKFTIILFIVSFFIVSQNKKETIYLLFDNQSKEKCKIEVEQTYENKEGIDIVKKYKKEIREDFIYFRICDELFTFHKTKSFKDTCSIKALDHLKLVKFDYLRRKYDSLFEFKHHVFKKIYFIEKISKDKIVKHDVHWVDEITMIED